MKKCRELLKNPVWFTVLIAFVSGIAIHLFGLINVLHNYDDICVVPAGYGTGLTSGRWFLTVLGDFIGYIWGNYNLPYANGVVFILLIAVSAGMLTSVFHIKRRISGALIGLIFVSFPSVTSVLFFKYTAVYYGFAILLSVLAVWTLERFKYGFFISVFCIAFSLGIYQAYFPITIRYNKFRK